MIGREGATAGVRVKVNGAHGRHMDIDALYLNFENYVDMPMPQPARIVPVYIVLPNARKQISSRVQALA